jgi:hypothetical protein
LLLCHVGGDPPHVVSSIIGSTDLLREERNPVIVAGRYVSECVPDAAIPAYLEPIKSVTGGNPLGYFPLQPMR